MGVHSCTGPVGIKELQDVMLGGGVDVMWGAG